MLTTDKTAFLLIDVQGKLAHSMHGKESLFKNLKKLVKGLRVLEIPILWTEQNPKGLGPTVPEIADLLPEIQPMPKYSFSCHKAQDIRQALEALNRPNILIGGPRAKARLAFGHPPIGRLSSFALTHLTGSAHAPPIE